MDGTPTRPDLLERFTALRIPVVAFLARYKLPAQMLSTMRAGKYTTPGLESIARLEAALTQEEGLRAAQVAALQGPLLPPMPEQPSAPPPDVKPLRTKARVDSEYEASVIAVIRAATTTEKMKAALLYVWELSAKGLVSVEFARHSNDLASQFRHLEKVRADEEAAMRTGAPVTVVVEYVNDWRGAE